MKIEDHYSALNGHLSPMDTEFAVDGLDGLVYIGMPVCYEVGIHMLMPLVYYSAGAP